jgi:H+/Cl- antiporter ClcA
VDVKATLKSVSESPTELSELQPLSVSTGRIVLCGIAAWVVALVVTLVVPALHEGDRDWWPWCCVAGIVLGFAGYGYVRRGRGNASDVS